MIRKLAKAYERRSWARFVVAIPWVGSAIHEYMMAKARESKVPVYRKIWEFKNGPVYIVCPQLDKSEVRQQPENGEYLYLGKYGDIDSLVEVLTSLGKLFPGLATEVCTSEEFINFPGNPYARNLILIGGPDYNRVVENYMQHTPYEFTERDGVVVLRDKDRDKLFESKFNKDRDEVTDYGFFLKMPNPNNKSKKLIMINGIHTYGVYGVAKCFLAQDEHERNISLENCKRVIGSLGEEPNFAVVLEVKSINKKIGVPTVEMEQLIQI